MINNCTSLYIQSHYSGMEYMFNWILICIPVYNTWHKNFYLQVLHGNLCRNYLCPYCCNALVSQLHTKCLSLSLTHPGHKNASMLSLFSIYTSWWLCSNMFKSWHVSMWWMEKVMQVRKEEKHVLRKSICTGKACMWNVRCL